MESNSKLFPLRYDLMIHPIEHDNETWIMMSDPLGYATDKIFVSPEFFNILASIDSEIQISELLNIDPEIDSSIHLEAIIKQIDHVNEMGFLLSDNFFKLKYEKDKEYIASPIRPAVCSGTTYPADTSELTHFLDDFFSTPNRNDFDGNASSIIVPHIDFRLGKLISEVYSTGYHSIRKRHPELFIILGTAHYANTANFMLTRKNFETPLGIVNTDIDIIDYIQENCADSFIIDDIAHKPEHSIEMQVLLLQYYFSGHNFKILPILAGSMHSYLAKNQNPLDDYMHFSFLRTLNEYINQRGIDTVYIASVDFAHIGRKFDDDFDAHEKLSELKFEDDKLIKLLENADASSFFNKIAADHDKWKVCGTAPIYSLLKANGFKRGELKKYNVWYEPETKSAVSFASMAFYDN